MKWGIVIDSSCDCLAVEIQQTDMDVTVVPLTMMVGGQSYVDEATTDVNAMLKAMAETKEGATSACPSPAAFLEAYRRSERIICITMTSGLSGTYNSARVAAKMLEEEDAHRRVHVIDTKATAGPMVLLMEEVMRLIRRFDDFELVCQRADVYNRSLHIMFTLSKYDNLIKTGRMHPLLGSLAEKLHVSAIAINTAEGTIEVVKKIRGVRHLYQGMIDTIRHMKPMNGMPVFISHCKNEEGARQIAKLMKEQLQIGSVTIRPCRCLTSFYALEGGLLIGF